MNEIYSRGPYFVFLNLVFLASSLPLRLSSSISEESLMKSPMTNRIMKSTLSAGESTSQEKRFGSAGTATAPSGARRGSSRLPGVSTPSASNPIAPMQFQRTLGRKTCATALLMFHKSSLEGNFLSSASPRLELRPSR